LETLLTTVFCFIFYPERKRLEILLQEESDSEDEGDEQALNLAEDDGALYSLFMTSSVSRLTVPDKTEDVWDGDSTYMEILAREVFLLLILHSISNSHLNFQGARLREATAEGDATAEDEDDDDDDDEDNIDEELGYISPLENVNPYVSFKQALTSKHRLSSASGCF
jgi:hypothetical protein